MEYLILVLLGLCFGSFINALVWRIRNNRDIWRERSECTHCHHRLGWLDLLPVISWLLLTGRCRYCRQPIEDSPVVEVLTALFFVVSYIYWPIRLSNGEGVVLLGLGLSLIVVMMALSVYDALWQQLPTILSKIFIGLALLFVLVRDVIVSPRPLIEIVFDAGLGVLVIAGLYWALYKVSKGKWVGDGDSTIGIGLGLLLGWKLAILTVFLANLLGLCAIVPGLLLGRITRRTRIPFGPFLMLAGWIALLWGPMIINWYVQSLLSI